ncbi:hypothetical protein [Streptomyces sp. DSM 40484]|uniref:hypothetical protein n=1 Tax=Streptomyces kroppenstedtii TaxID=3051181 RepID=UPI0028D18187|nr:hypothetical protein [Streptomyces sp. DSM 40484]
MFVVYTPSGAEPEYYDASSLKVSEAGILQRTVGMKWQELLGGLEQDDLEAMRGIVWVLKKRSTPSLRFDDFDPGVNDMTTRMDRGEIERWVDNSLSMADEDLDWATVEKIVGDRVEAAALDPEHARAYLASRAPGPKAPTPGEGDGAAQPESLPATAPSQSPTSSEPETATSASSPTSSTSHLQQSTTSSSATSTA